MSTLKADTIQSTGGGAATLTKQSAAKSWIQIDGSGTASTLDSFNSSSINDLGTGRYKTNFSNNMSNANYAINATDITQSAGYYTSTTSGHNIFCNTSSGVAVDNTVSSSVNGDLA